MKAWVIEVEVRVRKTLCFGGPADEATVAQIVDRALRGEMDLTLFYQWTEHHPSRRQVPVETIIDNQPEIVSIKEVPSDSF